MKTHLGKSMTRPGQAAATLLGNPTAFSGQCHLKGLWKLDEVSQEWAFADYKGLFEAEPQDGGGKSRVRPTL